MAEVNITYKDLEKVNKEIKTTDVKGKDYAEVPQRVTAFRKLYPQGTISTEVISLENGVCVMKATVSSDGVILGEGTAYEKENSSFINKTSYIENCVPLDTQILTKDGWKFYYQIERGDEVLSVNMDTLEIEYTKLLKVNVHKDRPLLNLSTSRFNITCTPSHKWIARTQYQEPQKVQTSDLTNSWKIIQNFTQDVSPSEMGRKLGWLMCDCEINYLKSGLPSTAYISQSKHIEEITELFGKGTKVKKFNEKWLDCYEWVVPAEDVRETLGHFKIATYEDLTKAMLSAPLEDVKGCYDSMMLADGESRGFSSTHLALVEAIQVMCARLGIATTFITSRVLEKSTKPLYTIGIKKTDGAYFSEMEVKNLPPTDVWCPTTENGTWFMKQGTFVTLTSNCETSAVGRALGFAGFGINTSIASAEEVMNAINNQAISKNAEDSKKYQQNVDKKKSEVKALMEETKSDVTAFLTFFSDKFERKIENVDMMVDPELDEALKLLKQKKGA